MPRVIPRTLTNDQALALHLQVLEDRTAQMREVLDAAGDDVAGALDAVCDLCVDCIAAARALETMASRSARGLRQQRRTSRAG